MIINTVGRIILKDGMLVFERFGAAVARKVKLGTAAFANIVNNATTTEEGFVPDARVVAQQQETISALQEQVDSLNSAIDITDDYAISWASNIVTRNNIKIIKSGNIINVLIYVTINKTGNYSQLCTVKEKYRPILTYIWQPLIKLDDPNYSHNGMVNISATGEINVYFPEKNINTPVFFNFCYIAK